MASTSGSIAKIEFGPAKATWEVTKRTKIPMMQYIKIMWTSGKHITMHPYIIGDGAGRDVLCGIDEATNEEASVVVKIQSWNWHEESNGYEFGLATTVMDFCTPEFYGVHRVQYASKYPNYHQTYDLSVSVVAKVPHTMHNYALRMFAFPLNDEAVCLIFSWVRCILELAFVLCQEKKMRVSDFHFKNIGLMDDLKLVLIDVEACTEAPEVRPKQRAVKGMSDFFGELNMAMVAATADKSWGTFRSVFSREIGSWWSCLHEVPSHAVISSKIQDAIAFTQNFFPILASASISTSSSASTSTFFTSRSSCTDNVFNYASAVCIPAAICQRR